MSTTIESLELEIKSSSESAVNGVQALADTLEKLKNATSGGLGLKSVANGLDGIKEATDRMGNITNKLNGLSRAVKELTNLGNIKVSASIGNQITKIGTALSTLDIGNGADKIQELVTALRPLETLGKSSLGTTVNALNKLPEALNKIDTRQLYTQIQSLTRIMKPLADEMQKVANGFNAFPSRIQRLIRDNEKLSQSNNTTSTSYINLWAKMRMVYNALRTGARYIASAIDKSNDYIENVNLFNVSMGKYAGEARAYAEEVGEVMGIDPGEWMRNQGVFMTLATGFGVAGDRANKMSKNLTQLGYDISSLFNMPYEDAMLKLQSGLAGELEPLRRIGYDLSVARLQQEAYTLGINKKVSAMTQAEKAELRYHAIMTQVTTSHKDMANTLDQPANQLRVLKSQINQAARAIGNIFIPLLQTVLPYLIAFAKSVRLVANEIAKLFGYKEKTNGANWKGLTGGADDYSDALSGAADNAKKLQQYTMGFDELNVIDPNKGSDSGSGIGVGGSGFDFELPEYDFLGEKTQSKVNELVEKIKSRLGEVLTVVGLIGAGFLAWKISNNLFTSIATLQKMLKNPILTKPLKITAGSILVTVGAGIEFVGLKSAIEKGLDGLNFAEIIGGGGTLVAGAALIGSAFGSAVIGASIGAIVAGVPAFFVGIYDACVNGIDWLSGLLIPAGATAAGAGIGAIIGMLGGPIGAGIGALIGLAVGALTDLGILIYQKWDEIKAYFAPSWDWFYGVVVAPVVGFFSEIASWFYDNVISPIQAFFAPVGEAFTEVFKLAQSEISTIIEGVKRAIETIVEKFREIFSKIAEILKALGQAFTEYVVIPFLEWVGGIAEKIMENVIEPIKEIFSKVGNWFKTTIIDPIWNKLTKLRDDVVELFKKVGTIVVEFISNSLKTVINAVLGGIERIINGFLRMLNGAIDLINEIPGVNITKVEMLSIPRLAEGGFPETGQMFIAREAGAEMVGTIGRRTAVANNDQIVAGIASGVAEANNESNALLREQNSLLRAMLEKESGVYLDGKSITKSVEKHQRERGRVLVTGGAY